MTGATSVPAVSRSSPVSESSLPGVNLVGFLEGELGLGEVARKLGRGFERAGAPFAAISYRRTPSRQGHATEIPISDEAPYDTNVICLNADYLQTFLADAGVDFFAGRYSIGVWFWESNVFRPENMEGFRFVDEVWVASEYVRRAIAAESDVPVHVVPLPIEAPLGPARSRADLELPDGFMFLFVFDFVSAQRKNPTAVVKAFKRAFRPGEGPVLVLKGMNGRERKPQWLDGLIAATEGRPDIHVVDAYVSAEERDALIASCDCYVSLHRSEGFGLTMAEAMARGKPVIATGYSGNREFMDDRNSYIVPHRLVPVPDDWWAYAPGAEWADPDVVAAAALMREVYENPTEARARGERGRESILSTMSLEQTAMFLSGRMSAIRKRRGAVRRPPDAETRAPILSASHELGKGVGASLAASPGARGIVRRLLVKALWPYLEEQHRVNAMTLDALATLQRSVDDLSQRVAELEGSLVSPGESGSVEEGRARTP